MTDPHQPSFHQLLADHWEFRMRDDPLFATYTGDHRFNDRMPGAGEADFARRLKQMRAFLERARQIDRSSLSEIDRTNLDLFIRSQQDEIAEIEFHTYRFPISKSSGFHIEFPELTTLFIPFNNARDYENYLARLEAFPVFVGEMIEVMRAGLDGGQIPPSVTLQGVEEQVRSFIMDDPEDHGCYKPFQSFPEAVSGHDQDNLSRKGKQAILSAVIPAYQALLKFLEGEYFPGARETIAASQLPDGEAYYQHRIRYMTTLDLTPQEIHQTGLGEVRRIRKEMLGVMKSVNFQGSFKDFIEFLRTDARFYAQSPEALLKETACILKRIDGELPRLFKKLPRMPYGIRPIPEASAPSSTTAYYFPPPGDGSRAGTYYVNTYDLKSRPLYEIEALSLHEAVPGHHLQIALQQELGELPNFRRYLFFTAYVEGWALYAERLGLEIGFYKDPYSNFGRLSYEMWRACRLVVDTGMHALGWTRQQAIDFMAENTSSTLLNIANEVDRYIAWPGQALAYKIGELKIRQLRQQAEIALSGKFDLRLFHDMLLESGALPLDLLQTRCEEWIYRTIGQP